MGRKTIPRRWCNGNTPIGVGPCPTGQKDWLVRFQHGVSGSNPECRASFFVYLLQIFIDEISSATFNSPFDRTKVVLTNSVAFILNQWQF